MKKKLLIASDDFLPRWDGVARFLSEVLGEISHEYEISVVAPDFPGEAPEFPGIRITRVPLSGIVLGDYPLPKLALRKIISEVKKADLVWSQNLGPVGVPAIVASKALGRPCAAYIHSIDWELYYRSLSEKNPMRSIVHFLTLRLAKFSYNRCSILMVPSQSIADLFDWHGIRPVKRVVPLATDHRKFRPPESKENAKSRIGINPEDLVIGYCGRIGREKDLMTLYRAFLRLRKDRKNIRLLVIGKGLPEIDSFFKSKEEILKIDYTNDVVPYLQAMDIYVLPSLTETTSLSTMEAMSCGIAVVSTKVGFAKDYIQEGFNGFFFGRKDPYGLYRVLLKLAEKPELRQHLGQNARETIISSFNWEKTLKGIKDALKEITL